MNRRSLFTVFLAASVLCVVGVTVAPREAAAATAPAWRITSTAQPGHFTPGTTAGEADFEVKATNVGGSDTQGPVVVSEILPAGDLTATNIHGTEAYRPSIIQPLNARRELTCSLGTLTCEFNEPVPPGDTLAVIVTVDVSANPAARFVLNRATVSGGGAPTVATSEPTTLPTALSATPEGFGLSSYFNATSTALAGEHPNVTTSLAFRNERVAQGSAGSLRDVSVALPPGLVANPLATPRCSAELVTLFECPANTAVGVATSQVTDNPGFIQGSLEGPFVSLIYNVAPRPDEPAAFAFNTSIFQVRIDTTVRRGQDNQYRAYASISSVPQVGATISAQTIFWGVPAEHNGPGPESASPSPKTNEAQSFGGPSGFAATPFWSAPDVCAGDPLTAQLETLVGAASVDQWQHPGREAPGGGAPDLADPNWTTASDGIPTSTGCERLAFSPSIDVRPDTFQSGAPAGYSVQIHIPQTQSSKTPSTPALQNAVVVLPPGAVVSPSAANGLEACSDDPSSPAGDQLGLDSPNPAGCPAASQVGTVKVTTPLLAIPLEGEVFVGAPKCSPCSPSDARDGQMLRIFLQAHGSGVNIKLAGEVSVNQATGQLTTTFKNNPQFPVEDINLTLNGGRKASLANPITCGSPLAATATLTPYSSPIPTQLESQPFTITGCSAGGFAPSFSAGTTGNTAGAFAEFTTTFSRNDGEPYLQGVQETLPVGVLGLLSKVPLCDEARANAGTCPSTSAIGHTTVEAGPGAAPVRLPGPGQATDPVYLTTGYRGAPFGLSIVVPAVAGPYNLGTVVVRAAISVDPHTSQIRVTSDPLPTVLDGIPLQLRSARVVIDRPEFLFNPTSCAQLAVTGAITSTTGSAALLSSRFQAADCTRLKV